MKSASEPELAEKGQLAPVERVVFAEHIRKPQHAAQVNTARHAEQHAAFERNRELITEVLQRPVQAGSDERRNDGRDLEVKPNRDVELVTVADVAVVEAE